MPQVNGPVQQAGLCLLLTKDIVLGTLRSMLSMEMLLKALAACKHCRCRLTAEAMVIPTHDAEGVLKIRLLEAMFRRMPKPYYLCLCLPESHSDWALVPGGSFVPHATNNGDAAGVKGFKEGTDHLIPVLEGQRIAVRAALAAAGPFVGLPYGNGALRVAMPIPCTKRVSKPTVRFTPT